MTEKSITAARITQQIEATLKMKRIKITEASINQNPQMNQWSNPTASQFHKEVTSNQKTLTFSTKAHLKLNSVSQEEPLNKLTNDLLSKTNMRLNSKLSSK